MRTFGNVGTYMHVIYAYSTTHIGYGADSDEIVSYTDGKRKNKAPSKKAKNHIKTKKNETINHAYTKNFKRYKINKIIINKAKSYPIKPKNSYKKAS